MLAVLLGFTVLGLVELGLRASGRWADPPVPAQVRGWSNGARLVQGQDRPSLEPTSIDGQPGWRTSRDLVQQRFMHDLSWTTQPEPGRLRVFTFGGSTTYGVPIEAHPEDTFPGRMVVWLARSGTQAEVINLGGASFGSDQVLFLATAVADQHPDAMVVYSGNNEFFQYDLALYRRNQAYPIGRAVFQNLYLFRALDALLGPDPAVLSLDQAVDRQRQVVARIMALTLSKPNALPTADPDGRWHRHDPHHAAVVARFGQNLRDLAEVASSAGSRLLIVDVPANLQQTPWLSLHNPAASAWTRKRVEGLLEKSAADRGSRDLPAAEQAAREAVRADPVFAESWHALGLALQDQGEVDKAELALSNALELDMDPGRPVAALGQAVRALTSTGLAERVDLSPLVQAPDAGPFGQRLFHDSCHLTRAAYDKVGHLLADQLRQGSDPTAR